MGKKKKQNAHPVQKLPKLFFQTGYVMELEKNRYFAGFQKGRVCVSPIEWARYFPDMGAAERYVHRYLGFAGMQIQICRVCWTLIVVGTIEHHAEPVKDKNGKEVKFDTYQEAVTYQKKYSNPGESMVDIHVFQEKEIILAA